MATAFQRTAAIRFALSNMGARNAHHEFEHLCRYVARLRVARNILPATGPVSAGGDQGRDFETYRIYLADHLPSAGSFPALASDDSIVFACTTQKDGLERKFKADITSICSHGIRPDRIYIFAAQDVEVALRHKLQDWAHSKYQVSLEIFDGQALSEWLADDDLYPAAQQYLHMPADASDQWAASGVLHAVREAPYWETVDENMRMLRRRMPKLLDRGQELKKVRDFAAGEQGYLLLTGTAFAGKSALLYEAVQAVRKGRWGETDVVCYFLSRRVSDASDAGFLEAVLPQLAQLCGTAVPEPKKEEYLRLWSQAATRAQRQGRHLLLIVDGLDEDTRKPGRRLRRRCS